MSSGWASLGVLPSRVMFIADASYAPSGCLIELTRMALAAGLNFIELRRKASGSVHWGSAARLAEIRACLELAGEACILVNDRVDLALAAGAHGAHVGQDDLPVPAARGLLGPSRLLGLSTHDEAQFRAAQSLPLDYVALGPVFSSGTKSGHAEPVGLDLLARLSAESRLPVVAIGGIDLSNARSVLESGAACLAVAGCLAPPGLEASAKGLLRLAEC